MEVVKRKTKCRKICENNWGIISKFCLPVKIFNLPTNTLIYFIRLFKDKFHLSSTEEFSFYLTVNLLHLQYNARKFNAVQRHIPCL
jgi:hypothetical protein